MFSPELLFMTRMKMGAERQKERYLVRDTERERDREKGGKMEW